MSQSFFGGVFPVLPTVFDVSCPLSLYVYAFVPA